MDQSLEESSGGDKVDIQASLEPDASLSTILPEG